MPDHPATPRASLTLAVAAQMIDAAFAESRTLRSAPLCIAVVGAGGHLLALQRDEAASYYRVEIATPPLGMPP
jgi:uncharacterized protein GlcG (DUF336 family)